MASTQPEQNGRFRRAAARVTHSAHRGVSAMSAGTSRRNRAKRQGRECCASQIVGELSMLVQLGGTVEPHPTFNRRVWGAARPSSAARGNCFTASELRPHAEARG
jgi:hypothetical protein